MSVCQLVLHRGTIGDPAGDEVRDQLESFSRPPLHHFPVRHAFIMAR